MTLDPINRETWAAAYIGSDFVESKYNRAFAPASAFGAQVVGDTIHLSLMGKVSTGTYDPASPTPLMDIMQRGNATPSTLNIDWLHAYRVDIDDVETTFTNLPVVQALAAEAKGELTESYDLFLMEKLVAGGTAYGTGTPTTPDELDADLIVELFNNARVAMNDARAPRTGRLAYVPGWAMNLLLSNDKSGLSTERLAQDGVLNVRGFTVVECEDGLQPVKVSGPDTSDAIVFTHPGRNIVAEALKEEDIVELKPARFGAAAIGLHVAGAKVIDASKTLVACVEEDTTP